jgi:hypothetical protein
MLVFVPFFDWDDIERKREPKPPRSTWSKLLILLVLLVIAFVVFYAWLSYDAIVDST